MLYIDEIFRVESPKEDLMTVIYTIYIQMQYKTDGNYIVIGIINSLMKLEFRIQYFGFALFNNDLYKDESLIIT